MSFWRLAEPIESIKLKDLGRNAGVFVYRLIYDFFNITQNKVPFIFGKGTILLRHLILY